MTQNAVDTALAATTTTRPEVLDRPLPEASEAGRSSVRRLIGVDLARGLAVFGMYAAHVGPDPAQGGATGFFMELTHGRSSALFAFLAGFSIMLITGRRAPKTGRAGRQAVAKVVIRAVILLALGTALTMTGTSVVVILAFYGLYFLLVLPLYRLGAHPLAVIAAGSALVLPQVLYVVQRALSSVGPDGVGPGGIWVWPADADGIVSLLFTGTYPALTWLPFVIAGMAVARLDLASTAVRIRLGITGVSLAVLGYGGSWLALHLVPGVASAVNASSWEEGGSAMSAWWSDTAGSPTGDTPAWLLVASPHSETTLSIVANTGVAIAVLAACLAAVDTFPHFRRLARPVIAVGTMSLTAYVFHILAIYFLGLDELSGSLHVLIGFIVAVTVFATLWSRFFRRGPLEWLAWQGHQGRGARPVSSPTGGRWEPWLLTAAALAAVLAVLRPRPIRRSQGGGRQARRLRRRRREEPAGRHRAGLREALPRHRGRVGRRRQHVPGRPQEDNRPGLRRLPQTEILRQVWVHHYYWEADGCLRWRDSHALPPASQRPALANQQSQDRP